jgi:hypothetical protein
MNSTQNQSQLAADLAALPIPSQDEARHDALHQMAKLFQANEQIWLVEQNYDEVRTVWLLDVVRRGAMGHWVRQRYRFDGQAETLYFMGERTLSATELHSARAAGSPFLVAEWQRK